MSCKISSINNCPVKSLSFQSINSCDIKKDLGMKNDRIFAFSRGVDLEKAKSMEKNPKDPIEYETILSMKRFACQSLKYYKISMHAYDRE